jgi:ABC-type transport system involved in multi-copper enzyme maturation permease subunit
MLTWRTLLATFLRTCWLSARIVLHRKLLFMALGVSAYYGGLYALAILRPGEGFGVGQALFILVDLPGTVLAVYLSMDLVAGERDRNTLEMLFTTSTSPYTIWALRLTAIVAVLAGSLLLMSTLAYFLFAEFPFVRGGLNALVPAFFVLAFTLHMSITTRSSNTAGMLALGLIVLVLLSSRVLAQTPYYLFLNPFIVPLNSDTTAWRETILLNRLGLITAGFLLTGLALRRMESRERLLS